MMQIRLVRRLNQMTKQKWKIRQNQLAKLICMERIGRCLNELAESLASLIGTLFIYLPALENSAILIFYYFYMGIYIGSSLVS